MIQLPLSSLIKRLNETCRHALEDAAKLCHSRTNYHVEVEHWLLKLVERNGTDLAAAFKRFDVHVPTLSGELTESFDQFKTGNGRTPGLSEDLVDWARDAWMVGSVQFGGVVTRSGHLLYALLASPSLARVARAASAEFEKISLEALDRELPSLMARTIESEEEPVPERRGGEHRPGAGPRGAGSALEQFTVDLTRLAREGRLDPVLGRDVEIRQIVDILTRRRQNNPILTGEAGVGKTAVVEGFAQRVADGDVVEALVDVAICTLDLGLLQAGAGIKGEFENRLKNVMNEVKASPQPIILFIDEAHTMIGAGGQAGQGDAANLLKPALARGELRTIAATTWSEYKKYFEKDAALARRFQVIKVEEPSEESGVQMMRGLATTLEEHHGVRILDEAVVDSVRISKRYISGRQLPDKSVSLLDTACARVAISHGATPPAVEDARRRVEQLAVEQRVLQREALAGADHAERLAEVEAGQEAAESMLAALEERWEQEQDLVSRIHSTHACLCGNGRADAGGAPADDGQQEQAAEKAAGETAPESEGAPPPERSIDELREDLAKLENELCALQGEHPLMHVFVDSQTIAEVVSSWTGIPVGRMVTDEIKAVLSLKQRMQERIVGQSHALEAIAQSIRTSRAGLTDPRRPIGVFLLVGSSGVGKTETALTLADMLYGSDEHMTVLNMSEFKEEHKVSLLMGSPPGYVGYGEGGVLTEAVRRRPYSVVLLDEMEKAHPGVQDIFYQVFDKGVMTDGEGRDIDFKNTVILMTSNAGTDLITSMCADPDTCPEPEALAEPLHEELLKTFKPAFLGRATVIPYYALAPDVMKQIIRLQLRRIEQRIDDAYRATFSYSDELVDRIADRCTEVSVGARNVDHILTRTLLPELSAEFLGRMAEGRDIGGVHVDVGDDGRFAYRIE